MRTLRVVVRVRQASGQPRNQDRANNTRCQYDGPRVPDPFPRARTPHRSVANKGPRGPSQCRLTCTGGIAWGSGGPMKLGNRQRLARRLWCHGLPPETLRNNALKPYYLPQTSPHIDEGASRASPSPRAVHRSGVAEQGPPAPITRARVVRAQPIGLFAHPPCRLDPCTSLASSRGQRGWF